MYVYVYMYAYTYMYALCTHYVRNVRIMNAYTYVRVHVHVHVQVHMAARNAEIVYKPFFEGKGRHKDFYEGKWPRAARTFFIRLFINQWFVQL